MHVVSRQYMYVDLAGLIYGCNFVGGLSTVYSSPRVGNRLYRFPFTAVRPERNTFLGKQGNGYGMYKQ